MPAAKLFGEPSRLSQNVGHCKYEDLFWNGKRKSGNFFEVSAFYRAFQSFLSTSEEVLQYYIGSTPVLSGKYCGTG